MSRSSYSPDEIASIEADMGLEMLADGGERCRKCNGTGFAVGWALCMGCFGTGVEINDDTGRSHTVEGSD